MSWDKGFNFRGTDTYVTDGANETYVLGEAYPTTRNGVTFGFTIAPPAGKIDRNSATDRRLAGINYNDTETFQVDLPATGDYILSLALGDYTTNQTVKLIFKDNTTTLATIGPHNTGAGQVWMDATGVDRSPASDWAANNVSITKTFASTTLNCVIGNGSNNTTIAHLFVSQVAAAAAQVPYQPQYLWAPVMAQ